ncbi:MAG: phytanoyl-CoA dioxygenase family protein, partial [Paenibacillus sp.]|nr:phytanoyl-CoA dioxygenase family protein [Paenibacillus sp.]
MSTVPAGKSVRITEEQMKQYEEQGYIVFEQLFGTEEIDAIRGIIDGFDEESELALKQKGQDFVSLSNQINFTANLNFRSPAIQQFIADQRFVDITTT